MRSMKTMGLAAIVTLALTAAVGVGSASATTLEIGGAAKNESVAIEASLDTGTSTTFQFTSGAHFNTCTGAVIKWATESPYTALTVGGGVLTQSFSGCTGKTEVVSPGTLTIERINGTTNGTVVSSGAEWKIPWGTASLTCKTGAGADIGMLRGDAPGKHASLTVSMVLNCEAVWVTIKGSFTVTSPTELGVIA